MPADFFADRTGDERSEERADVNPHIKNIERVVAARVVFLVKFADHNRDARLEETVPQGDQEETENEAPERGRGGVRRDRRVSALAEVFRVEEAEFAERHQGAAEENRAVLAEEFVGDEAAEERKEVDEPGEPTVKFIRVAFAPPETRVRVGQRRNEVENQEGAHSVIAEAFPHFGGEEGP